MQAIQLNLNNLRGNFKALSKLHHDHPQETQSNRPSQTNNGSKSNSRSNSLLLTNHCLFSIEEANENDTLWSPRTPLSNEVTSQSNDLISQSNELTSQSNENPANATASVISQSNDLISQSNENPVNVDAPEIPQSNEVPVIATAPVIPQSNEMTIQSNVPSLNLLVTAASQLSNSNDVSACQTPQSNDVSASQIPQSNDPSQAYATEEAISMSAVDSLDVMCDYMIMTINKGSKLTQYQSTSTSTPYNTR